ncbi:hypothetical protein RT761_01881 [Atribacter laminatus]|jgi:hypothetical protein|uniref:Uncharacterized protein n=1 Tax=Atribacter laminatus TaxID=2847778 RepID=A0A7T1AMI6_ATRLM|nr:hypothetical protein RT761_01881 [Atribacter laminatus]
MKYERAMGRGGDFLVPSSLMGEGQDDGFLKLFSSNLSLFKVYLVQLIYFSSKKKRRRRHGTSQYRSGQGEY